jgi:hypothetical protein
MLCFNDNAHEMMVHMLMPCSYGCTDARQTPGVLHVASKTKTWMRWMMLMLMKCNANMWAKHMGCYIVATYQLTFISNI